MTDDDTYVAVTEETPGNVFGRVIVQALGSSPTFTEGLILKVYRDIGTAPPQVGDVLDTWTSKVARYALARKPARSTKGRDPTKKTGRPRKHAPGARPVTVYLDPATLDALDNLAARRGESRSDVMRSLFAAAVEQPDK